ncbi:MAG TPA: nitrilase family protein [Steroidobacteraceae bacterium]|nr:nitrilase family protein [Steroidobacteraceae bacterium]
MPNELRIATAQFESRSADKAFNLATIEELSATAARSGADVAAFHECSITGYTFARRLSRAQLWDLAEVIPGGPSIESLTAIARRHRIAVLAGLFERGDDGELYKAHVCVDKGGVVAKHRKIHPFINPHIKPGSAYTVFELGGWKCGILICYDNNVIENVRATALLGAEIVFMPHVTMCTPSTRPGAGFVDPMLWLNRATDPAPLRAEFDGPKGRAWLMKWLPARAYDNGIFAVFSNPIGMDDDQLKNGCSMVIDPFGDVIAECRLLGNDIAIAHCSQEKIALSGGHRYREARKPELYRHILGVEHQATQKVSWMSVPESAE